MADDWSFLGGEEEKASKPASRTPAPKAPSKSAWQRFRESVGSVAFSPTVNRLVDSYTGAAEEGMLGPVVRKVIDWTDYGMPDRPDLSPEQRERIHDEAIRVATIQNREERAKRLGSWKRGDGALPMAGRVATDLAGTIAGGVDPTYLANPFGGAKGAVGVAKRIAGQAGIAGAVDTGVQGVEVAEGIRDEIDPARVAINAAAGGGFQSVGEAASATAKGVRGLRERGRAREEDLTAPLMPVRGRMSSGFGRRTAPKAGASTNHMGVDIAAKIGTPIRAPSDGTVVNVGRGGKRGNWVEIDHGDGHTSRYLHMDGYDVKVGDSVSRGQVFGRVGATGNVTGPHLHWSVYKGGKPVNPMAVRFGRRVSDLPGGNRADDFQPEQPTEQLDFDNLHPAIRDRLVTPEVEPSLGGSSRNAEEYAFQRAIAEHSTEHNLDHVDVGRKYFDEGPENPELVRSVNYRARQIMNEIEPPRAQEAEFSPEMDTARGQTGEMDFGPKGKQDVAVFSTEGLQRKLTSGSKDKFSGEEAEAARRQVLDEMGSDEAWGGPPKDFLTGPDGTNYGSGGRQPPNEPPRDGGGDGPDGGEPPRDPNEPRRSAVDKLGDAIKEAKPLREAQERAYSRARAKRALQVASVQQHTKGEAGFHAELSQLKGELPKVAFESIRNKFTQGDVDELFDLVKNHPRFSLFDKINARTGLAKMLGSEGGAVPTESEIKLLSQVFPKEIIDNLLKNRPFSKRFWEGVAKGLNIPRSLMASFDLSAPGRQGIFLIGNKAWWTSWKAMFKSLGSEKAFQAVQDEIASRPTYKLMQEARLSLTDNTRFMDQREEAFMSDWAEKIPAAGLGIKASNRAYMGYLNKLRADTFDSYLKLYREAGIDFKENPKALRDIAKFVNAATGRGGLGKLNQAAPLLSGIFFSPRLMASRLQLLNPVTYAQLDPIVRKQAIKSLLTFSAAALSVLSLAKAGGAEVEDDPRSADFGKIKVEDTRYDILGGFQQYIRLGAQLISGQTKSASGKIRDLDGKKYGSDTRLDVVARFFTNKESPIASFVTDMLRGKNAVGEEVELSDAVIERVLPFIVNDTIETVEEYGSKGLLTNIPSIFGVGTQTYKPRAPKGKSKKSDNEWDFLSSGESKPKKEKTDEWSFLQ